MLCTIATASSANLQTTSFFSSLTPSDWVQISGIILSTTVGFIAILISIFTLRQSNKMIEESSRPIVSVYTNTFNPGMPMFYLVVKNYGQSSAQMLEFKTDFDFSNCYGTHNSKNYIEDLSKCLIAPGQSKTCYLDFTKINRPVRFSIKYKSAVKTYREEFVLDLTAAASLPVLKYATKDKELLSISYSLQEMILKNL